MVQEKDITVENMIIRVVISDDEKTLLAAKAAGRVIVGVAGENGERALPMARYLVAAEAAATEQYLEQVVRREKGLPWMIKETDRLLIREFTAKDAGQVPQEPEDQEDDRIFQDIASESGIYDVNYFRKLFKKITGKTPTEYVKQVRTHGAV